MATTAPLRGYRPRASRRPNRFARPSFPVIGLTSRYKLAVNFKITANLCFNEPRFAWPRLRRFAATGQRFAPLAPLRGSVIPSSQPTSRYKVTVNRNLTANLALRKLKFTSSHHIQCDIQPPASFTPKSCLQPTPHRVFDFLTHLDTPVDTPEFAVNTAKFTVNLA